MAKIRLRVFLALTPTWEVLVQYDRHSKFSRHLSQKPCGFRHVDS